ncbi:hypothetical protein T02_8959 [Trichinella nativa]|uniref:Uncharacterized protein n=1 Tax=Trichinella nativa TaxID=6335 RepID=A0A0V1KRR0_9BILA|nr:hypothetical protein T02_8959 [Trichinella nativa]
MDEEDAEPTLKEEHNKSYLGQSNNPHSMNIEQEDSTDILRHYEIMTYEMKVTKLTDNDHDYRDFTKIAKASDFRSYNKKNETKSNECLTDFKNTVFLELLVFVQLYFIKHY